MCTAMKIPKNCIWISSASAGISLIPGKRKWKSVQDRAEPYSLHACTGQSRTVQFTCMHMTRYTCRVYMSVQDRAEPYSLHVCTGQGRILQFVFMYRTGQNCTIFMYVQGKQSCTVYMSVQDRQNCTVYRYIQGRPELYRVYVCRRLGRAEL